MDPDPVRQKILWLEVLDVLQLKKKHKNTKKQVDKKSCFFS